MLSLYICFFVTVCAELPTLLINKNESNFSKKTLRMVKPWSTSALKKTRLSVRTNRDVRISPSKPHSLPASICHLSTSNRCRSLTVNRNSARLLLPKNNAESRKQNAESRKKKRQNVNMKHVSAFSRKRKESSTTMSDSARFPVMKTAFIQLNSQTAQKRK